jgi:ubiquinone/menaquinone biosynthesis C-methylase UbiE
MKGILKDELKKQESNKLFNFLSESESSKFYDQLFNESFEKKERKGLFDEVKLATREKGEAYKVMETIVSFLEKELHADAIVIELGGGRYQERSANAYKRFKYYYPLDISYSSIKNYSTKYDKEGIIADATNLPFKDDSVDCIFTHTFLEHPLAPEKILSEIVRVLKPGGIVVHNDAWFCRWWHRYGIVGLKKYNDLPFKEKIIWLLAKLTEISVLRIPPIIVRRFIKNILNPNPKNIDLSYIKLKPNYNLYLGCDEDAASSIDPIDVVRFYESRGFKLIDKLSFKARIFYPNKYVCLKKFGNNSL